MWRIAPLVIRLLAVSLVALVLADPGPGGTSMVSRKPDRPERPVRATGPPRRQGRKKKRTTTTTTVEPDDEDEHTTIPTTTIDPRLFDHKHKYEYTKVSKGMLEDVKLFKLFVSKATNVICMGTSEEFAELVARTTGY
ncbi:unnamed protein product [Pieris macdunnoughi]|uniref:Uncharacterized protein n=1 Tax=Pieris macdunnoughi TaxID=345717 RepID=A0A821L360_9NEOP|nr:unnamed protein product [Pieris macdunnoughi]